MNQQESALFEAQFRAIMEKNGLQRHCTSPVIALFSQFTELFQAENTKTNLSAIRDTGDILAKHYADCLLAEEFLPKKSRVLDVGCGGGFPCIPLAIARQDLTVTGVDSTAKKIRFVEEARQALELRNLSLVCARVENKEFTPNKSRFDAVIARAVANMRVLAELTLPFIRVGGLFVALKGAQGAEEAAEADRAIRILGGKVEQDVYKTLFCPSNGTGVAPTPDPEKQTEWTQESRHILIVRKIKPTPAEYPRPYAAIQKRPL